MTGQRPIVVRGRRGTLVLATDRQLTDQEHDEICWHLRRALSRQAPAVVLSGDIHVEGIIPGLPRASARSGYRPRWAR